MSILGKIEALRAEALKEVWDHPSFAMVRALDDAVAAAGGDSLVVGPKRPALLSTNDVVAIGYNSGGKKVSQGDVAEAVLKKNGPMPIGLLLEGSMDAGAKVGGEKPLASFRSMLSKDERFYSLQRNNMFFWWLNGVELPEEFMPEPEQGLDLQGSGNNTNQEGGDGHAANNTNLAS